MAFGLSNLQLVLVNEKKKEKAGNRMDFVAISANELAHNFPC